MRTVGNFAVKRRYTTSNPFRLVVLAPRPEKGALEIETEHLGLMMRASVNDLAMQCGHSAAFGFGHRCQEIVGMCEHDLIDGKLHVTRQLKRIRYDGHHGPRDAETPDGAHYLASKGGTVLSLGKLKSGKKDVTYKMTPEIEGLFRRSPESAVPTVIWDSVDRKWRTVRFVVHGGRGGPLEGHHFRALYSQLCDRVDAKGVLHDLRALFASELLVRGEDIHIVSRMLRHCDIQTSERYFRGLGKNLDKATEAAAVAATRVLELSRIGLDLEVAGQVDVNADPAPFFEVLEGGLSA
jgi:hypothetical protein